MAVLDDLNVAPRSFVVPRRHLAAAACLEHMHWLTDPNAVPGTRNAGLDRARSPLKTFVAYEDRWDLLMRDQHEAPVLLPPDFRTWAQLEPVWLPAGHPWQGNLPEWQGNRNGAADPSLNTHNTARPT